MEFGLWFEPEMINLDSGLARDHPDWVLGPFEDLGPEFRHQYVVDLTRADAWEYLLKQVDQLIAEYRIDYLKWDHNRDLLQAVSAGRPAVHYQTLALYRLLDAIKERRPTVEIETCAGDGGRIDLGILQRTDRVWASDCNDPVERQQIQRWTGQLLPPELVGSHLADRSHTTSRITDLSFRLATALFSHPGIEADLTRLNRSELETVTAWGALYKDVRTLIHTGRVVRADLQGDDQLMHGVVADDGSAAIYCWARLATAAAGQPGRILLPGLPEDRRYRIRICSKIGSARRHEACAAGWIDRATSDGLVISGALWDTSGSHCRISTRSRRCCWSFRRHDPPCPIDHRPVAVPKRPADTRSLRASTAAPRAHSENGISRCTISTCPAWPNALSRIV